MHLPAPDLQVDPVEGADAGELLHDPPHEQKGGVCGHGTSVSHRPGLELVMQKLIPFRRLVKTLWP
ncbi:hypothetical protein Plo01_70640 [Planobispora longispora]|uniref:Uncharacterized protein n=1 Tax=Planobispora longispora TaxID=28887 RepID=A0A8J3RTW0_9ACTN|nr:hypothetical protein Plo01_70640 [Planobispora longispora]